MSNIFYFSDLIQPNNCFLWLIILKLINNWKMENKIVVFCQASATSNQVVAKK